MKLSSRHCGSATPAPQRKPCACTSIRSPTSSTTRLLPFALDDNLTPPARHLAHSASTLESMKFLHSRQGNGTHVIVSRGFNSKARRALSMVSAMLMRRSQEGVDRL